jgi:hypothetical protein
MTTSVQVVEISMLRYIPELVAWGIGLVLAVIMVTRGGGKAEKLLLAGCSLMLAVEILPIIIFSTLLRTDELKISALEMGIIQSVAVGLPSLAGLVCLVLAFWFRFRRKRPEAA